MNKHFSETANTPLAHRAACEWHKRVASGNNTVAYAIDLHKKAEAAHAAALLANTQSFIDYVGRTQHASEVANAASTGTIRDAGFFGTAEDKRKRDLERDGCIRVVRKSTEELRRKNLMFAYLYGARSTQFR